MIEETKKEKNQNDTGSVKKPDIKPPSQSKGDVPRIPPRTIQLKTDKDRDALDIEDAVNNAANESLGLSSSQKGTQP